MVRWYGVLLFWLYIIDRSVGYGSGIRSEDKEMFFFSREGGGCWCILGFCIIEVLERNSIRVRKIIGEDRN